MIAQARDVCIEHLPDELVQKLDAAWGRMLRTVDTDHDMTAAVSLTAKADFDEKTGIVSASYKLKRAYGDAGDCDGGHINADGQLVLPNMLTAVVSMAGS